MNVLVLNCGSSSLKYRLIAMPEEREVAGGEAQRIGPATAEPARILHRTDGRETAVQVDMPDHAAAFEQVMHLLEADPRLPADALGHRVVHGGAAFSQATRVDQSVLERLAPTAEMAPLHNPPAIRLIRACGVRRPDLPQVAVFDTAFHSTIPEYARTYALPRRLRAGLGIRKYGFHGTSHQFVAQEAARFLGKPPCELNAVSCHLGSGGASLCAIRNGRSVENTMGYSPLQGLVMSTRSGDLDPAVALRLLAGSMGDPEAVERYLNRQSGVLGLSGFSADIRDVLARAGGADRPAERMGLARDVYLWRIRKYLGAYLTLVGRPDAVIFTDTVGEGVPAVRATVCAGMEAFGLQLDAERNRAVQELPADVAADAGPVRILVIATNEELAIARRTYAALSGAEAPPATGDGA